jgi:hypothetical protein
MQEHHHSHESVPGLPLSPNQKKVLADLVKRAGEE